MNTHMNVVRIIAMLGLGCSLIAHGGEQSEAYDANHEVPPPTPFPAIYKNYQILPGTVSPNQQCALIYPKRSALYSMQDYGLFLVTLKPFRVLSQLPLGNSNLASNVRCGFSSDWAKDSSAVVVVVESRWGPEKVSLIALKDGNAVKQAELTSEAIKEVRPSFRQSKASPYNEYYEFVFQGFLQHVDETKAAMAPKQGWDLDHAGHVMIDCVCTTDPKGIDSQGWTVRFTGIWDVTKGTFLKKTVQRLPSPDLR